MDEKQDIGGESSKGSSPAGPPVFSYDLEAFSVERGGGSGYILRTVIALRGIAAAQVFDLTRTDGLKIGLKFLDSHSRSAAYAEVRADLSPDVIDDDKILARFPLSEANFRGAGLVLGQLDFVYEGRFWFDHQANSYAFLALENPYDTRPARDVFDYYRARATGER